MKKILKTFISNVFLLTLIAPLTIWASNLPLKGKATYSWLFFDIYDAQLWSKAQGDLYDDPLILELIYKKNFKGSDILKQTKKELSHAGHSDSEIKEWATILENIFPDVSSGDTIKASYVPGQGLTFFFNTDSKIGYIQNLKLEKAFLDIWLGDKTSDPQFRKKLLGL